MVRLAPVPSLRTRFETHGFYVGTGDNEVTLRCHGDHRELPSAMPAPIAITGAVIAGVATVESLFRAHG